MSFTIRRYQPEDLETIKRITVTSFDGVSMDHRIEELYGEVNGHSWQWRKARNVDDDVARDSAGVFVVECDAQVVGSITTWIDHEASVGYIPNLSVDALYRGKGIGRALVEYALDYFRDQGLRVARIETLEENLIGKALYPSVGFRELARQIHYCVDLHESGHMDPEAKGKQSNFG